MKEDLEKLDRINAELSRLLKIFRGTLSYDVLSSIRKELRTAFDAGFYVEVQLFRPSRLVDKRLRFFRYIELELLDIRVEEIEGIFCQKVVSCK